MGELKRRSPSAGSIYDDLDPSRAARTLADAGCAGLSVLTEPAFFGGSLATLTTVRAVVDVPLLRKDFVLEPYQVVQARAFGADAVLLLAAVLDDDALRRCADTAAAWGMTVLAEAHGETELARLLRLELPLVGVNARDLNTFEVNLANALAWTRQIPADVVVVAESGVRSRSEADRVSGAAVDAVLVGEGLMRGGRVAENFRELFGGTRG
jgi:indole-3-glycerol phosphate synthase